MEMKRQERDHRATWKKYGKMLRGTVCVVFLYVCVCVAAGCVCVCACVYMYILPEEQYVLQHLTSFGSLLVLPKYVHLRPRFRLLV